MSILYCDCYSGISGDMFLGSLIDAGLPPDYLKKELTGLDLPQFKDVCILEVKKGALRASLLDFKIEALDEHHPHRHLSDIETIINKSSLAEPVRQTTLKIFHKLAEAEARVHGSEIEHVHFHEVGAVDSILDIVGAAVGLHYFNIEKVYSSALPLGTGTVHTDHGLMPLPAPATLELLRAAKAPMLPSEAAVELITPTGAAILAALAVFEQPHMVLSRTGTGAGRRDLPWPNILRIMIGDQESPRPTHVEIETNIDDMNPQYYGYVMDRLFAAGALDVTVTPIMMKKNRPGSRLSVIADKKNERLLAELLLRETTTLGVRVTSLTRYEADRELHTIQTALGELMVKVKKVDGRIIQAAPEYDTCVALAKKTGRPLDEIFSIARDAAAGLIAKRE